MNFKPVAVKAKKDGFMHSGTKFCTKGGEYPIAHVDNEDNFEIQTLENDSHYWNSKTPEFNDYFEVLYSYADSPKINLQVDKIELGLLLQLLKGDNLLSTEKRELSDLLKQVEQLVDSLK